MWRSIVLGKLIISIIASAIVSSVCFQIARHDQQSAVEAAKWYGLSVFFLLIGIGFSTVIYLLLRKPKIQRERTEKT